MSEIPQWAKDKAKEWYQGGQEDFRYEGPVDGSGFDGLAALLVEVAGVERERWAHLHHAEECPKCHTYCTQSTTNDYGVGKFAVYPHDCACEIEREARTATLAEVRRVGKESADELLDLALGFPSDSPGDPRAAYQREAAGIRYFLARLEKL